MQDYCCGWCKTGHNDWYTLIVYWLLPNGLWILFPSIIAYVFIAELSNTLKVAGGVEQGATLSRNAQQSNPIPIPAAQAENGKWEAKNDKMADVGNPYLVDHTQLPSWSQDNAWIVKGYRRPGGTHQDGKLKRFDHGTVYKCWRSVWAYWHNETGKFRIPFTLILSFILRVD